MMTNIFSQRRCAWEEVAGRGGDGRVEVEEEGTREEKEEEVKEEIKRNKAKIREREWENKQICETEDGVKETANDFKT